MWPAHAKPSSASRLAVVVDIARLILSSLPVKLHHSNSVMVSTFREQFLGMCVYMSCALDLLYISHENKCTSSELCCMSPCFFVKFSECKLCIIFCKLCIIKIITL